MEVVACVQTFRCVGDKGAIAETNAKRLMLNDK